MLFIHQNFPGQFRHAAQAWSQRPGWRVLAIGRDTAPGLQGVPLLRYDVRGAVGAGQHPYLRTMESAVRHGQAVARVLMQLKAKGFKPDAIVAHPGWGETLYVKDVFPQARLVHFCEWFYRTEGADVGFDAEFPVAADDLARIRTWNALHLLNLEQCDAGITPTHWQHSQFPLTYRDKITVAHDGIDLGRLGPDPAAAFEIPVGSGAGTVLRAGEPIVTYVARNLEPYRGFHQFMRALARIQAAHATCQAVIVGADDVSYGRRPREAASWRERMLSEVRIDPARTHFVGKLPYDEYVKVLQVSAAHVYLTYPFVLGWSMLEAMACGCLVIGSNTASVSEVLRHDVNGRLAEFFDATSIAASVVDALEHPARHVPARTQAFEHVRQNYRHIAGRYRGRHLHRQRQYGRRD